MSYLCDDLIFDACLTGVQEVPSVSTITTGQFKAKLHPLTLDFSLQIQKITGLTQAHIHLGLPGENGPIVAFLYGPTGPSGPIEELLIKGSITSSNLVGLLAGKTLEDLVNEMVIGNTYVNAHTSAHPGGEIRGRIKVQERRKKHCSHKRH